MIDLYPKSISKATGSTQTPQAAETGPPPPSPGFMTESEKISQENYFDFDFVVFFFTQYDGNIIIILTSSDARIKCETSYRVDIPTIQNKAALCSLREVIYNINDVIMQSQKICIFSGAGTVAGSTTNSINCVVLAGPFVYSGVY